MKFTEKPRVLLQDRVQVDRYNVLRGNVKQTEHAVLVIPYAPPVGEVPATFGAGF